MKNENFSETLKLCASRIIFLEDVINAFNTISSIDAKEAFKEKLPQFTERLYNWRMLRNLLIFLVFIEEVSLTESGKNKLINLLDVTVHEYMDHLIKELDLIKDNKGGCINESYEKTRERDAIFVKNGEMEINRVNKCIEELSVII